MLQTNRVERLEKIEEKKKCALLFSFHVSNLRY